MRLLYSALWWVGLPFVLLRLWRRGRKEPGYRQHIGERLGFYDQSSRRTLPPLIWVHAVSVGETRAAQPLIEALLQTYPQHTILLTHMTATGRATGQQLFAAQGERVIQSYLPYDTAWMCARFLRHFKPQICILMETEVWPNMVRQCVRAGVPVMLANARLSARSLRRGQRFGAILLEAAAGIDCVAAQSEQDAERLRLFGARQVHVTGSIKFDVEAPAEMIALGKQWRAQFGERPVLLCASTREGEEALILDALVNVPDRNFLTVIVPRHPQRFDEVASMISARGFVMQRRSTLGGAAVAADTAVVLGDSMGEMAAYYAACETAFIGGSLLPLGGQNLIEASALGIPVLIGEHTFNFQMISDDAVIADAALRVNSAADILQQAQSLFADSIRRTAMAQHAQAFARQHQGATVRTMALLDKMIR
ncbi:MULTISPECIES: lipid IV(A) 3-deoxy-D-manno-octulosonic acid transferase [unclassified Herbaspirillum]|jgi:3-deoxy-D-manno-octulosonic-acid transferase|uniref:lipid IV(A) 3-deoxy-D-manno-octulosonic acid transferase n=1 Tax=unclassified Herbaspirillum TaxID=2624150 RepID=UPI000E2F02A5|nr:MULTISPECIES: lipid IV(A) 3-deoxy-D-manno-octulosonic acid transferase [unclassified Herbaspirillum]RFB67111.1 3-deoxy-D-manno-octulosonic acid transferase [Herbaspirillum sp. 3R-3a1]TFI06151.1 3-deoxy-D-manno-octulosonic acid transferase [Herbaspirillum sp. 3R11]TFI14236.1 3-deoxy-D-manno-octulosonic acid transferase [Herbaspirillum sp. 3R-11]TFI22859.1 3-deoxy-D-manno-octulosonic acid transferase [Herbaspirillum sp. 3C11]